MKYVLDASVAVKWVLPEPDSAKALTLWDDLDYQVYQLLAPDTFPIKIAYALTRAERRGLLRPREAGTKLSDVLAAGIDLHLNLPLLTGAVDLSSQWRICVYDRLYAALAEQEQCPLVTANSRLVNIVQGKFSVVFFPLCEQ